MLSQAPPAGSTTMSNSGQRGRRGVAIVMVLVLLLVVGLIIIGMVLGGGRDAELSIRRWETVQAFYAAEAGMNMAVREMMVSLDEDGDGTVGTISDDGVDANNPTFGSASVYVAQSLAGGIYTLTSTASAGKARRWITTTLE